MLTMLLLLSLSQSSPAPQSCPRIEWPALSAPRVEGMPEPLPVRDCSPTKNVAALMYSLGIDAAEPVEVTELDADIYQTQEIETMHTSSEIARAILARCESTGQTLEQHLDAPKFPQAVELPKLVCSKCGGCGALDTSRDPQHERLVPCEACGGAGETEQLCDHCREPATVLDIDGRWKLPLCAACATGGDDVVSFALAVLP